MKEKVLFSWSGGKDSSIALYKTLQDDKYQVDYLLTNFTEGYDRISMHGVRRDLLELQTKEIGIKLHKIYTSKQSSNEEYEEKMGETFDHFYKKGYRKIIYGDIFLEDLKDYRIKLAAKHGFECILPLWKLDTTILVQEFLDLGFKSKLICTNSENLEKKFCGEDISQKLLNELPDEVDPCGENGEFHSFVYDGPIFKNNIKIVKGEIVERGVFHFCDILQDKNA